MIGLRTEEYEEIGIKSWVTGDTIKFIQQEDGMKTLDLDLF
jgi:hypothetical protein